VALAAGQRATALLRQRAMRCGGCGAKVGASTLAQAGQGMGYILCVYIYIWRLYI
jgi:hypothetical protein